MIFKSASPSSTKKIAADFAKKILKNKKSKNKLALVIGLVGNLGAGKTIFIQGLARALGVKEKITSPTFIIMRSHKLPTRRSLQTTRPPSLAKLGGRAPYKLLTHLDAYRLKNIKETKILNLKRIIENPENIILIEWAEKLKKMLPKKTIWINFEHGGKENERIIKIKI